MPSFNPISVAISVLPLVVLSGSLLAQQAGSPDPFADPALAQTYNPEADPLPTDQPYNPEAGLPAPGAGGESSGAATAAAGLSGDLGRAAEDKPAEPLPDIQCDGKSVCREPGTGLPFRVLTRAFSKAYKDAKRDDQAVAREALPALSPLYVFARRDIDLSDPAAPQGWYQVSATEGGPPFGWMQAADAVEWRQALIVSYTHPGVGEEERQRVLMFEYLDDLQLLVESDERETQALAIYEWIDEGKTPAAIVSKEPQRFVNITDSFYLLPIVDYRSTDIDGDETRFLRLGAAVPEERGADTLENREYREQAQQEVDVEAVKSSKLDVDIVFVMDMTRSMQPYIDNTREAVKELAKTLISQQGLEDRVRFGLVGFRDDAEQIKALEFTAKNFTPELLPADPFIELVEKEAKATRVGSVDYAEEVYAGVDMAIDSNWRDGSIRFLVLVGDASAHEPGHKQSTTHKDAAVLHQAMVDQGIYLLAIHLKDYRMSNDHPIAEAQFSALAKVPGSTESALVSVELGEQPDYDGFRGAVADVAANLMFGVHAEDASANAASTPKSKSQEQAQEAASALRQAALVEYLGRGAEPPKDILVWAVDRDLTNPSIRALEVRVLVNKAQLSSLIQALDRVTQAMVKQQQEQIKLFEALQSLASATMKNPDGIAQAQKLADTGLLPKFIEALPYKSEILSLTEDSYASFTADQRAGLEASLAAKLQQYRDINESVDGWVKLNPGDPDAAKVYPLHLSYLP